MIPGPPYLPSAVPPGASGEWAVDLVTQRPRSDGETLREDPRPECFRYRPGTYRRLRHGATTYMTDLYDEWFTQVRAVREARRRGGRALVTGLGLGLVVEAMLAEPDSPVEQVTVVEVSSDVIRLVGPHLRRSCGDRVELVQADAFEWTPPSGTGYSVGWHDVWPDPHGDAVTESMRRLEARFSPYCDWQGSWPRDYRLAESGDLTDDGSAVTRSGADPRAPQ